MDVVLIGVSDRSLLWKDGKLKEKDYESFVEEYARYLAKNFENVIVTPDDGVYTDIAVRFGELKGRKAIAYYPDQDKFYGYEHLKPNFPKFDVRPIGGDWYKLNAELTKQANAVISIGFSPGVLIEGGFIKYHQKYAKKDIRWFIDERCISQRLPKSFHDQIRDIQYFSSLEELDAKW